jgi:biopolymer transport protein ExbD
LTTGIFVNLHPSRREAPDINLTPLIDVVFLLLIFFMVSTTFRKESDIRIDLPEASQQQPSEDPQTHLEVVVDAAGRYLVNGQALLDNQPHTLKKALAAAADSNHDQTFIIRADAKTPHQAVVTVMDIAGQMGFRRLAIATLRTQPDVSNENQ